VSRDPVARRLLRDSRPAARALGITGALAALTAALVIAQAVLLAGLLADGFAGHGLATGALVGLAAVFAARALVTAGFSLAGRLGALAVMGGLRQRLAARLLDGAGEARSGELTTASVQGVDALEAWFTGYLPQVLLSALVPPAILVFLLTRDAAAALVLAVTVPVLIAFMILIGLTARARTRARWRALAALGAHFADVVRGLPTLRAHVRERAQTRTMDAVADRYRRETLGTLRIAFLSAFVLELAAMLGTALVAATVGLQLVAGALVLRDGLIVLLLAPELYAPLRAVGQQFHASEDGLAAAERIYEVLDGPAGARGGTRPAPDPARHTVRLRRVRFGYPGRGEPVLRDVSLTLHPGETVAVTGVSGAGKSTLAALLLRFADPAEGTLTCGADDLRDVDTEAWRARIAWVPQRPAIVAGTVADNIRLGAPDAGEAHVRLAAVRARAHAFVAALPEGYETRIGEGGRPLSAGEAQRIALARAFLRDAPLVVLDEPTAHLDPATAADIEDAVLDLCRDRTALLIAHRPQLAARADRVVELRDGALAGRAPSETAVAAHPARGAPRGVRPRRAAEARP
jgi:thiol reductant ABC exporter CydD subunit